MGGLVLGEDRGDEGADAAFAFGAGYVDDVEAVEVVRLDGWGVVVSKMNDMYGRRGRGLTVWPSRAQ